jgi:hypothetical protein
MKKIYYLFAFVALAFTACQKEPVLQSTTPLASKLTLNITLQQSDYAELASGYPKTSFTIDDLSDANYYIPQILNAEYLAAANGSTAKVTYTTSALYFKVKDSLLSDVSYTLTHNDYLLLTGNTYTDFSPAQMLQWMNEDTSVYQTSVKGQEAVVTFTPYPATLTPPVPYTYVKTGLKGWQQAYMIQPAQYTTLGDGKYNQITPSTTDAVLAGDFAYFLKNDITIMDTVKKNDIIYVSFNYYVAANTKAVPPTPAYDYQRIIPLQYDGNNFVAPYNEPAAGIATFVKANGTWKAEPVVAYTLQPADYTAIENGTAGTASARANLKSYGDFDYEWTIPYMDAAIIEILPTAIPSPQINTLYQVTFSNYDSPATSPLSFTWSGTAWVAQQ